jgi:hypothetical protein
MEQDPLERTIVIKVARKKHGDGDVPAAAPSKSEAQPKSPEEARERLAVIASLYRLFRG